jgi:hypothetical protein
MPGFEYRWLRAKSKDSPVSSFGGVKVAKQGSKPEPTDLEHGAGVKIGFFTRIPMSLISKPDRIVARHRCKENGSKCQ